MSAAVIEPFHILSHFFELKKKNTPSYSVRALSRDLEISHSYLSRILNGKMEFPVHRTHDFVRCLSIDEIGANQLKKAIVFSWHQENLGEKLDNMESIEPQNSVQKYEALDRDHYFLLKDWIYLAILDLISCENFRPDIAHISKRLGIAEAKVEEACDRMKASGCLTVHEDGSWSKNGEYLRFPSHKASMLIRNFHRKTMIHTMERFQHQKTLDDLESRLLSGQFIAGNPKNFARASKVLTEAIFKAAEILEEGEKTELYHIGLQAVPWTDSE